MTCQTNSNMDNIHFASAAEAEHYLDPARCTCTQTPASYSPEKLPLPLACHPAIHRLPEDLLSEIFTLVALPAGPSDIQSILALLHVDRRWRLVALRMPGLWTGLATHLPPRTGEAKRWRECMSRSGTCPLNVTFTATDAPRLLHILKKELQISPTLVQRFQSLSLFGHSVSSFSDLLLQCFLLPSTTLLITKLSLTIIWFDDRENYFHLISSCPPLKRLSITRSYYRVLDSFLAILTAHLPDLESIVSDDMNVISPFVDPQLGRVSLLAPRLERLTLQGTWLLRPLLNPDFSTVRVFTLRVSGKVLFSVVLETIYGFPNLRDLTLVVNVRDYAIDPVLVRALPRIERLDITACKQVVRLARVMIRALTLPQGSGSLRVVFCNEWPVRSRLWEEIGERIPELRVVPTDREGEQGAS